jgi:PPOX class probable F420-dependent enzyme
LDDLCDSSGFGRRGRRARQSALAWHVRPYRRDARGGVTRGAARRPGRRSASPAADRRRFRLGYHLGSMTEPATLAPHIREFLATSGRFLALASIDEDGTPRQAVIWYRLDPDDAIVVNSRDGRRWPANLRRDGRVALAVTDGVDGYRWVGMAARVETVIDDQAIAQADIEGLAWRYYPTEPELAEADIARFRTQRRVTFRLRVTAVHDHLDG